MVTEDSTAATQRVSLGWLLAYHAICGDYIDPENGVWVFPHMYFEGWS